MGLGVIRGYDLPWWYARSANVTRPEVQKKDKEQPKGVLGRWLSC